jgi:hypothetical protein
MYASEYIKAFSLSDIKKILAKLIKSTSTYNFFISLKKEKDTNLGNSNC